MTNKLTSAIKYLEKKRKKGFVGYPLATVAYYGPNSHRASKVCVGIVLAPDSDPAFMKKCYSKADVRKDMHILADITRFMKEHDARSVVMIDRIIGCPHEEAIDYPSGGHCPECLYWKDRDRWSQQKIYLKREQNEYSLPT